MAIDQQLAEGVNTPQSRDDLALSYYKVGLVSQGAQRMACLEKSLSMYEALCREYPEEDRYARLCKRVAAQLAQS